MTILFTESYGDIVSTDVIVSVSVLELTKVLASIFFIPHPYLIAPTNATDTGKLNKYNLLTTSLQPHYNVTI